MPFNAAPWIGTECDYIQQAFEAMHVSGDGAFTKRCQRILEQELGVRKAFLTTSCTDALEMAALLLNIQPGDQIIVPSFTFVSAANAFVLRGATPVFAEIRPDTLNIDEALLDDLISPSTRAIIVVHYGGVGCEMDRIVEIAEKHGVAVIEDNAHGLFGSFRGRPLGTFGCLATQSFHETKNFSCGEGGALLINDEQYVERAEIMRDKGTNRSRFFRGEVDKYTWVDLGSSFLPSDILAAALFAQLERREYIQDQRRRIWNRYQAELQEWAGRHRVGLPFVPDHCQQSYHLFYMRMPNLELRTALIAHLRQHDILSVFHYVPLHLSEMGRRFGGFAGQCPISEQVSDTLVRLPMYAGLSERDQGRVIDAVKQFSFQSTELALTASAL
ncbi:MAG: dTDP-4-amino-4,6-dideoxygalactose transaminase [Acidobacteriaceae bacterium]|nr:dTDP-4-amino-4,6-dideoxygalactose transaminase [Acidobacteriaceae bacterium]MBV8569195.1 dTDP-4-amino-4,6-dideoxygalactose transaminase [Acidobacteriaceae bacterium]